MWAKTFSQRLLEWNVLRAECSVLSTDMALDRINQWWQLTPWRPYYLHWDYQDQWPTPWEILDDNFYCPITRALGMIYTLAILDLDVTASLVETAAGETLVIVNSGTRILNTDPDTTLNSQPTPTIVRSLDLDYFKNKI